MRKHDERHSVIPSNPVNTAVFLTALLLLLSPASATAEWTLVHDEPLLRVEARPYQGSNLDEIRGRTEFVSTLGAVMALLRDADYNAEWVYRSGGARILQQTGDIQAWVHGVVDAPAPMRDRDTVVRFDYAQDAETCDIQIEITNEPQFLPEQDGLVRVPDFGGFWRLQPLAGGRVAITYQVRGDPGGWVPLWLANYAARRSVLETLRAMPAAAQRYVQAAHVYACEPNG